jgi:hypothetical protein
MGIVVGQNMLGYNPNDCVILLASGNNSEAFDCFGKAIEADPGSALA